MDLETTLEGIAACVPTDGDTYQGEDGRLYCSRCHTPRQSRIVLPWNGTERLVGCVCRCMMEAERQREAEKARVNRISAVSGARVAGFPRSEVLKYSFDKDDGGMPTVMAAMRSYVDNFPEMQKSGKGLLLYGNVGTGKTFAAGCVVNALEDMGHPALMTSFSRLANVLFDLKDGRQRFLDRVLLFDLVMIDDLGAERDTEYMSEQVTNIVDSLYRANIPMLITSNYTPRQMTETDDVRKRRVYDRLLERCYPILVDGPSRRKQQGRRDLAEMNKLLGV